MNINDHSTGNTNIHADRSTLSEQYCTNYYHVTSNNGITGTWSPATINTATAGTTTYTFTPTDPVSVLLPAYNDITVTPQITPTFTQIGPLCQNSTAPILPVTSNNGITGTWSPATINTATAGTTTYTFTPTDAVSVLQQLTIEYYRSLHRSHQHLRRSVHSVRTLLHQHYQ